MFRLLHSTFLSAFPRNVSATIVSVAALVLVTACSSSGNIVSRPVTAPRTVNPPESVHPDLAPYLPIFISAVEALGFHVATTTDPRALQLKIGFNPSVMNMRVSAALWQNAAPIVTADAANSGWGTALARGSALQNLVDSAANAFRTQLHKMSSSLQIVDDTIAEVPVPAAVGEITIEANVPNADVYVNGKFVGSTPLSAYKLVAGEHQIQVSAPGYVPWKRTLSVVGGTSSRVGATLETAQRP